MPDIAMCQSHECPRRVGCYRYMATPNEYRQSYMEFRCFDEKWREEHGDHFCQLLNSCAVTVRIGGVLDA